MNLEEYKNIPSGTWVYTKHDSGLSFYRITNNRIMIDNHNKMVSSVFLYIPNIFENRLFGIHNNKMFKNIGISQLGNDVYLDGKQIFLYEKSNDLHLAIQELKDIFKNFDSKRNEVQLKIENMLDSHYTPCEYNSEKIGSRFNKHEKL